MPNARQTSVIASPSSRRATKRKRSSITELAFHGINTSRPKAKSVTHVSGTKCHLSLRPLSFCPRHSRLGKHVDDIFGQVVHDEHLAFHLHVFVVGKLGQLLR